MNDYTVTLVCGVKGNLVRTRVLHFSIDVKYNDISITDMNFKDRHFRIPDALIIVSYSFDEDETVSFDEFKNIVGLEEK